MGSVGVRWKRYVRKAAARGRGLGPAQLVAEPVAELRVAVGIEGLVDAAAHGPEEARAGDEPAIGRVAEAREQEAGRAPVAPDRVVEVGQVEGRHALDAEHRVRRDDLVVDLDRGAARAELPARVRLRAGGEAAALDLVRPVVDPLDALRLDEDTGLDVADRVVEEAVAGVVHLDAVAREPLFAADEDHVALGDQPALRRAVRLRLLVDVGLVGEDAQAGHVQVHGPARLHVALLLLLVGLGLDANLARLDGLRVVGGNDRGPGGAVRLPLGLRGRGHGARAEREQQDDRGKGEGPRHSRSAGDGG